MAAPLLETKLYLPTPRSGLVSRPQLCQLLDRGAASKLLLVSAPAGFGKTTMLAEWLATQQTTSPGTPPAAWLSLDRGDNQSATFWTYVVAALQKVAPEVGATALDLLQATPPLPVETVLTTLLNDLAGLADDHVLVLDDYHVVEAPEVHDAMAFLLEHLPAQVHVVIASRTDPRLPVGRLRARGELAEIRVAALRFTPDETAAYCNGVMGLELTTQDVIALEDRTEGWIAALQLAALSMQGRDDVAGFIAGFAGDDRYIVDYLAEEVLARQPEAVRDFLIRTSILGRLTGPLVDAVTGTSGGKAMLETLERGNLFVVPLDDRRQWYRYHHLFADVLRARLGDESPELAPQLHRRASDWYADNGDESAATQHALAGGDWQRAADLVERALPALQRDRQEGTVRGWLALLPDQVVQARPVLSNGYAAALLSSNQVEGVERHLDDAERWLTVTSDGGVGTRTQMVVVNEPELHRLPAGVAVHRAGLALLQDDPAATLMHAKRALELARDDDDLNRAAATALIGLVAWGSGDLDDAYDAYTTCTGVMRRVGHLSDVLGLAITLADIRVTQGRLRDAMRNYEHGLRLASDPNQPALRGTADMYVGMSALHRERNDLDTARQFLRRCQDLGEHNGLPQNRYRWRVATGRVLEAEGDYAGAVDWYDEAERVYVGDFSPDVRPVSAVRARAWLRQGRVGDAFAWAQERGVSAADDLSYLREYEHVTLARALLAESAADRSGRTLTEAAELLARLLQAAEAGGRTGTVIEVLVLQALTGRANGDLPGASVPLERALALAEPEGYVRTFVDEGAPMAALLATVAKRGIARHYASQLLAALGGTEGRPATQEGLIEPLSERELDVLRLLRSDLGGPEIARELVVSLNTVRTHTKNIYAKLGVNSRRAAVRRAEELGLASHRSGHRP